VPGDVREICPRLERSGADDVFESSTDGSTWSQLLVAHLHADDEQGRRRWSVRGSPKSGFGYVTEFACLTLSPI